MGAAESHPEQDPRYLEVQRELQRRNEELDRREQEIDRRERELKRKEEEIDRRESELMREMARREEEMARTKREERIELMREMARTRREERRELMRGMARREEEMVGHCERQSVPAVLGLSRIHSDLADESLEYHFSGLGISFGELKPVRRNRKEEMVGHCERQSFPAVLGLSRIHSDESPEDDLSDPWISFKELRINLEKDEEAEEMCGRQWMTSHPEPPRSPSEGRKRELESRERQLMREMARRKREERIELMRGMARTKREEDRRELMRGMARREEEMVGHCERKSVPAVLGLSQILSDETQLTDESSEYDFIEPWISFKELRRNLEKDEKAEEMCGRQWMTVKMEAAESHPQPPRSPSEERKRELERREEEIDRRETERIRELKRRERELMREMAIREEEMARTKREEERIELMREMARTKREERIELMRGMARTKREERIELMRGMARREEEMVGHCERRSVPAVLGLSQILSDGTQLTDESSECDFSEPWIFVNPVRRNSKELTPPYMSESEDNPLDGL